MSTSKVSLSNSPGQIEPVKELLNRAVGELRDLSSVVNELEALVGNLVLAGSFGSSNSIYDLQKLDHMRQHISGVADFLHGIRRISEPNWTVDTLEASADVKLAELSNRLRGGISVPTEIDGSDAGHFELFGSDEMPKVA